METELRQAQVMELGLALVLTTEPHMLVLDPGQVVDTPLPTPKAATLHLAAKARALELVTGATESLIRF